VAVAWLRTWLEVVDSGGFARAAPRLHLSQPRISAHVASLERALGCELIDRSARPLALTDEGRRLLPKARAIVAAVDDTVSDMKSAATTYAGKLTIASFASASDAFLPAVLMELRAASPLLEVAVIDGDVKVIESTLSERRAAVALRPYRPDPADPALVRRGLWSEPFVVLAPGGHPLLQGADEAVRLEQIARYPVITIGDPLGDPIIGFEALSAMHSSGIEASDGGRARCADHGDRRPRR
jgi:DNA-binding transcriptional LysR family regulator